MLLSSALKYLVISTMLDLNTPWSQHWYNPWLLKWKYDPKWCKWESLWKIPLTILKQHAKELSEDYPLATPDTFRRLIWTVNHEESGTHPRQRSAHEQQYPARRRLHESYGQHRRCCSCHHIAPGMPKPDSKLHFGFPCSSLPRLLQNTNGPLGSPPPPFSVTNPMNWA